MENYRKIATIAADLFQVLLSEGFDASMCYNKLTITCRIHHELCAPIPPDRRDLIMTILRDWLRDRFPDLPLGSVDDLLRDAVSGSPADREDESARLLAIREYLDSLNMIINVERVREAEDRHKTRRRARDVANIILQNCDVYGRAISIRDIELIGHTAGIEDLSYRQSMKIMKVFEDKGVAHANGHIRNRGRDLDIDALKKFLRS